MVWDHVYLAEGTRQSFDKSGLSMSRKFVSNVLREDCPFELPEHALWSPSFPLSILMAS